MEQKKVVVILVIILVVLIGAGFYLGFVMGKQDGWELGKEAGVAEGNSMARQELQPLVDLAFPAPPKEVFGLSAVVKYAVGAVITIEVDDLDDYLPHKDRSPRKTELRRAVTYRNTSFTLINYAKQDSRGNPTKKAITLQDVKPGDRVIVWSNENIRDKSEFTAERVEVAR